MLVLAAALERAKREGFILVIHEANWPFLEKIDRDLFNQTFYGHYTLDRNVGAEKLTAATEYWCGLKASLASLREGFRPNAKYRELAERELAAIRQQQQRHAANNKRIVSVHLRSYDGLCEWHLPDICEARSAYQFKPKPFGCNQTLTRAHLDYLSKDIANDNKSAEMEFYLSTDRQSKPVDDSYLFNPFGIRAHLPRLAHNNGNAARVKSREKNEYLATTEMLVDMWVSVLADHHVAMLRSSCDKIVAEWRFAMHQPASSISPPQCFANYYQADEAEEGGEFCAHVKFIGLDTGQLEFSPHQPCDFLLALAVALLKAKAHGMGQVHLYGKWAEFAREALDFAPAREFGMHHVAFRDVLDESLLYQRKQIYDSSKLRGSGLNATNQALCGKELGAPIRAWFTPRREFACPLICFDNCPAATADVSLLVGVRNEVYWNCP